jgi:hypothetical protein
MPRNLVCGCQRFFTRLHDVASQNTTFNIFAGMITSDLIRSVDSLCLEREKASDSDTIQRVDELSYTKVLV